MASWPPLSVGKKLSGACAMKYATAISPARTNATGRVKRPIELESHQRAPVPLNTLHQRTRGALARRRWNGSCRRQRPSTAMRHCRASNERPDSRPADRSRIKIVGWHGNQTIEAIGASEPVGPGHDKSQSTLQWSWARASGTRARLGGQFCEPPTAFGQRSPDLGHERTSGHGSGMSASPMNTRVFNSPKVSIPSGS
jgi:hypothetical protein